MPSWRGYLPVQSTGFFIIVEIVSEPARIAVEEVLKKVNYRPNIHITGLSLKRKYKVVITTPNVMEGEYWESIHSGIQHALESMKIFASMCDPNLQSIRYLFLQRGV